MVAWLHLIPQLTLVHQSLAERLENIGAPAGGKVLFGQETEGQSAQHGGIRARRTRSQET